MSTDEGGDPACWAHLFEEVDDDEVDDEEVDHEAEDSPEDEDEAAATDR